MFVGAKLSEEATLSGAAEGPEDRGAALFWTQLFAMIVPFVFICLRAYVRFFITKSVHWDDGLMFFAFVWVSRQSSQKRDSVANPSYFP